MARGAYPSIEGKIVLLTGSTGPMGRVLVDAFLSAGARLALCVRRMAHLPDLEQELSDRHEHAMIVPCDLRFEENVVRMVHRVVQRFGQIDVIINAAAILGPRVPVIDYPMDPWRDVLATNLTGAYLVCREALPWMTRQHAGCIINVTTKLTRSVCPNWGAYLVGNFGVEGLTKMLATELKGTGIRVNTVDIGMMGPDIKPETEDTGWVRAFLYLASDDSMERNGEKILASEFMAGPEAG